MQNPKSILLVDDNLTLTRMIKKLIQTEFQHVYVERCASAREFHSLMTTAPPFDMAFFDWMLPDGYGAALASDVQNNWPDSKIVLMSGKGQGAENTVLLDNISFLEKPIDPQDIFSLIRGTLGTAHFIEEETPTTVPMPSILDEHLRDPVSEFSYWHSSGGEKFISTKRLSQLRHQMINCLSHILMGTRVFELELKTDIEAPSLLENHIDEYVNRTMQSVKELNALIKQIKPE